MTTAAGADTLDCPELPASSLVPPNVFGAAGAPLTADRPGMTTASQGSGQSRSRIPAG